MLTLVNISTRRPRMVISKKFHRVRNVVSTLVTYPVCFCRVPNMFWGSVRGFALLCFCCCCCFLVWPPLQSRARTCEAAPARGRTPLRRRLGWQGVAPAGLCSPWRGRTCALFSTGVEIAGGLYTPFPSNFSPLLSFPSPLLILLR